MNLQSNEIHIWLTRKSDVPPAVLKGYYQLMNDAECTRNQRYRTQSMRDDDAITRAVQRTVLSQYQNCRPQMWQFDKEERGKPFIVSPETTLDFNLSHSRDWVACAVARSSRVGVDIENAQRKITVATLAKRYFSEREYRDVLSQPTTGQKDRFFDYWTLKESYIKARGEGIALGLAKFGFELHDSGAIGIHCDSELQDDPAQWRFMLSGNAGDHRLALAIKRQQFHGKMKVSQFLTIPLHSITAYSGPLELEPWREPL